MFMTSFGVLRAGPLFGAEVERLRPALRGDRRRRAYRRAAQRMEHLEIAASVLASLHFAAGNPITATP